MNLFIFSTNLIFNNILNTNPTIYTNSIVDSSFLSFGDVDFPTPSFTPVTSEQIAFFLILISLYLIIKRLLGRIVYVYSISPTEDYHYIGMSFSVFTSYGKYIFVKKEILQRGYTNKYLIIQKEIHSKSICSNYLICVMGHKSFYCSDAYIIQITT